MGIVCLQVHSMCMHVIGTLHQSMRWGTTCSQMAWRSVVLSWRATARQQPHMCVDDDPFSAPCLATLFLLSCHTHNVLDEQSLLICIAHEAPFIGVSARLL